MSSTSMDDRMFHKLVRINPSSRKVCTTLLSPNGQETVEQSTQLSILSDHYSSLATPTVNAKYDAEYLEETKVI